RPGARGGAAVQRAGGRLPRHAAGSGRGAEACRRGRGGARRREPRRLLVAVSRAAPGAGTFLLALLAAAGGVRAGEIDSQRSGVGFSLVTSWREAVDGSFPVFEGRLTQLPDGRQQVRLALSAADVVIHGSARNTYFAR